jgi:hypothetical protein
VGVLSRTSLPTCWPGGESEVEHFHAGGDPITLLPSSSLASESGTRRGVLGCHRS